MMWRCALDRGLLPDDEVARQISKQEAFAQGRTVQELRWPEEPLVRMCMGALLCVAGGDWCASKWPPRLGLHGPAKVMTLVERLSAGAAVF